MKNIIAAILLFTILSCSSNGGNGKTSDTTVNPGSAGNSDGINTIGMDTAHMDTSLRRIETDGAK